MTMDELRQAAIDCLAKAIARDEGISPESWAAQRLRQEWWVGHGCGFHALYGDDGEMQCHDCHIDFKREPLDELREFVESRRLKRAADSLRDGELEGNAVARATASPAREEPKA